jgi:urea carboxylase-associated protein 2
MSAMIQRVDYATLMPSGSHWSLRLRPGTIMRLNDVQGSANVGMLLYNSENLLERYNAPDTLKCQHTFKLTAGHCLYSDMGRVLASVVEDTVGWHESICGNSRSETITRLYGRRDYQNDRNEWHQNGHDAFLVELAKYGLRAADMAANINWFSKVSVNESGVLGLDHSNSQAGGAVTLRFEMDVLVLLHTCPHPLNRSSEYPRGPVQVELGIAAPMLGDDPCRNHCDENRRGFENNALYYLGAVEKRA